MNDTFAGLCTGATSSKLQIAQKYNVASEGVTAHVRRAASICCPLRSATQEPVGIPVAHSDPN